MHRKSSIVERARSPKKKVEWSEKGPTRSRMDDDLESSEDQDLHITETDYPRIAPWRSLFNFTTKKHSLSLVLAMLLSVGSGIVIPVLAYLLGKVFDSFANFGAGTLDGPHLVRKVSTWCLALVGLGSASWLLNGGYFMCWLVFGELQAKSVRDQLFKSLIDKDMEWYDMRTNGIGALISRLQTQTRDLQIATSQPLGFLTQYIVTTVAALGLALYSSWNLTLVTLATLPISALVLSFISAKMQPSIEAQEIKLTQASKIATNAISSIDTVKCFNGQDFEIRQYSVAVASAAKSYLIQAHANASQIGFVRLATLGMFVQGFWYGSTLVHPQGKSAGQILTTFWACLMATQAIEQILPQMIVLEKGRAAGATLKAVMVQMERGRRVTKMVGMRTPVQCNGDIEVRNVSFAYPTRPDQLAISKATFFFGAGETTFVIGRSGSGKSTLGNLLMRYYTAESGDITVDGHSLMTLDINWLRNNVTLVQQQSILFNETIFKNIAFGRRDHVNVTKQEVLDAIQVALLQNTVNDMPDGLDTVVGNSGNTMSGGQKQRVALARARLRDTPILILDEATSALDYVSRSLVMDAIREWRRGKTTIIITHDITQIYEDDYVYVLDKGHVVQQGFRKALEDCPAGPFSSFLPDPVEPTKQRWEKNDVVALYDRPHARARSEGMILLSPILSSNSRDSLDIKYPERLGYIPSVFGHGLTSRRPSQSIVTELSPLSPPTRRFTMSPAVAMSPWTSPTRSPLTGIEMVDLAGRKTMANRSTTARSLRRKLSVPIQASMISEGFSQPSLKSLFKNRDQRQPKPVKARRIQSIQSILSTVWSTINWKARGVLVIGFFCALLHAAATPLFSWVFSKLLATFFLTAGRSREALKWSLAVLGVALGDSLASYGMHYCLEYSGQAWIDILRGKALRGILDQPRSWFDRDKNSISRIVESLDRNAEEMRNLVGRFAGFIFVALTMMGIAIIWSLALCWKLTIVGLATAPFMYAITRGFEVVSGRWEGRSNDASENAGSIFTESFTNIRVVRALTLESYFQTKYAKATDKALMIGIKRAAYSGLFFGLSDSGIIFVTALIFYYGASLACNHRSTTQDIITVFTMLLFSIANANAIVAFIPQINSSRDTASRLLRLSSLPLGSSHEHSGNRHPSTPGTIAFNALKFTYLSRPGQPILRDFSLDLPLGTCTAIVGSSGSGKSTVASLLLGLYPPDKSDRESYPNRVPPPLTINGIDIRAIHTPTLRTLIAIVPQSPTLFPSSVAANIAYGLSSSHPHNTSSNIRAAANAAGIDDFIMSLPRGYETLIGEGGTGVSGGQAQRIAIARALVRRPRVLVLDEATSSLDQESAEVVRESVRKLISSGDGTNGGNSGMSVLIVTHSREMMTLAQEIVVMDRGRVVQKGPYKDLIRRKGEFRRLLKGGEWEGGDEDSGGGVGLGIEGVQWNEGNLFGRS